MFPFSKQKEDDFDSYKSELLQILQNLQALLNDSSNSSKLVASKKIQDCCKEISSAKNHLTLALPVKWLEREIGSMIYDEQLQLTVQEQELWQAIKNLNSKYSNVGHGAGLGL